MAEDGYEEQIIIPKEKRELAAEEGISTENKQKVTVQIMNLKTGEFYIGRLAITGNRQIYLPIRLRRTKGIRDSPNPDSGRVKKVGGIAGRRTGASTGYETHIFMDVPLDTYFHGRPAGHSDSGIEWIWTSSQREQSYKSSNTGKIKI